MVFGVEEFHAMGGIEEHYGGRRMKFVGASMHGSANFCDFLNTSTHLHPRSEIFSFTRYVYSLNYAVPTLGVYREKYYLVEMSIPPRWWLLNETWKDAWKNEITFQLNGDIMPMYYVAIHILTTLLTQALNYHYHDNQSTSPTPTSLVF